MLLRGQASIKGLSGSIITLESADITNLEVGVAGNGTTECSECMKPIESGEKVYIVGEAQINDYNRAEVKNELQVVHVKGKAAGSCLEDFVSRVLSNTETPKEETPVETKED